MGHSGTSLKFSITIDLQIFSNQIPISDLSKRYFFFQILSYIRRAAILVSQNSYSNIL